MNDSKRITHVAGTFLVRASGSFLNGGGLGQGEDRTTAVPKTFEDGVGNRIPYVSAQSWRRWLRNTLIEETGWPASELRAIDLSEKGTTNKIAGELNPVDFAEDDIFGYMRAAKGQGRTASDGDDASPDGTAESGADEGFFAHVLARVKKLASGGRGRKRQEPIADQKSVIDAGRILAEEMLKEASERVAAEELDESAVEQLKRFLADLNESPPSVDKLQKDLNKLAQVFNPGRVKALVRSSPFASSLLVSIRRKGWRGTDEGFVHLKEGTPLPYRTEFYNADLQAVFSLDFARLGVFWNLGDRIELDEPLVDKFLREKAIRVARDEGRTGRIYELTDDTVRVKRARELLRSLAVLRGGAKQAAFGTDVAPKVLIVAGMTCGNPIFNHLFKEQDSAPALKVEALSEITADYSDRIATPVYLGIRTGYLANEEEVRAKASSSEGRLVVTTPVDAAARMGEQLGKGAGAA